MIKIEGMRLKALSRGNESQSRVPPTICWGKQKRGLAGKDGALNEVDPLRQNGSVPFRIMLRVEERIPDPDVLMLKDRTSDLETRHFHLMLEC